jgi:hypothetical protein
MTAAGSSTRARPLSLMLRVMPLPVESNAVATGVRDESVAATKLVEHSYFSR